ncbi:XRE family transcriptional regulator [Streptococcus thoraltensis]|uniref:XRE family transcriptional regulator n=1 Tax=Streptococcus thoraltensis TaxID=55085 RepID=UPI003CC7DF11
MYSSKPETSPHVNNATVAENIKLYRKQTKLTQKELATKLGIAPTAVSAWELGRNKPLMDNIEHMASIFGIAKSTLLGETLTELSTSPDANNATVQAIKDKVVQLHPERQKNVLEYTTEQLNQQNTVENSTDTVDEPTIYYTYDYYDQALSAGTGQYLNNVQVEQIELPVDIDADFVVPIYGDSMEPDYHSGDYVFVKLSVDLIDGDIGVFEYYGDAYIKQLVINENSAFLHSLNKNYDDIPIDKDSDFRIIGEVVGSYSEKEKPSLMK